MKPHVYEKDTIQTEGLAETGVLSWSKRATILTVLEVSPFHYKTCRGTVVESLNQVLEQEINVQDSSPRGP